MTSIYDDLYQQPDYYGKAMPEVLDFFKKIPKNLRVLDVGCGQGRYAIPLAEMGFDVTGLDNSKLALRQTRKTADASQLKITLLNCNVYTFRNFTNFDVLLFNLFFHFNEFEKKREIVFLETVFTELKSKQFLILTGYKSSEMPDEINKRLESRNLALIHGETFEHKYHDPHLKISRTSTYFMLVLQK